MKLREQQKVLTRGAILGAVLDLVADGQLDELSVPAVARRSGVSVATIYRYFPTRDELLTAAAAEPSRQALAARTALVDPADELASFQQAMWISFAENMALLRHQVVSEVGREMRAARLEQSRRRLGAYVEQRGVDPASSEGERLVALLLLTSGSLGLLELSDRQALPVDVAIEYSRWAADALIEATKRKDGDHL